MSILPEEQAEKTRPTTPCCALSIKVAPTSGSVTHVWGSVLDAGRLAADSAPTLIDLLSLSLPTQKIAKRVRRQAVEVLQFVVTPITKYGAQTSISPNALDRHLEERFPEAGRPPYVTSRDVPGLRRQRGWRWRISAGSRTVALSR